MNDVPARSSGTDSLPYWSALPDSALWNQAVKGKDTLFAIGIKQPGTARGMYRGQRLVERSTVEQFVGHLEREGEKLRVIRRIDSLPVVITKLSDIGTLSRTRSLPFVDYVEPYNLEGALQSGIGCSFENFPPGLLLDSIPLPAGGFDVVLKQYGNMRIERAWTYSTGQGTWLGMVDTGVDRLGSSELSPSYFASGLSSARVGSFTRSGDPYTQVLTDNCGHGTRVVGVAAAPRDGRGMVGVAYGANLISIDHQEGDVVSASGGFYASGVLDAGALGAKVIGMAFGTPTASSFLGDAIDFYYYNGDVLFIGAAGTTNWMIPGPFKNFSVFPASKSEVMSVSGVSWDGTRPSNVHYGSSVEAVAYVELPSPFPGTTVLSSVGGSSASTGVIAGIAALVRTAYPFMTNEQVRARIKNTSGSYCGATVVYEDKLVNAEAAVGGLCIPGGLNGTDLVEFATIFDPDETTRTYSVNPTGGSGPVSIVWSTGDIGPSTTVTWPKGDYALTITAAITDAGASNPALVYRLTVTVHDYCDDPGVPPSAIDCRGF